MPSNPIKIRMAKQFSIGIIAVGFLTSCAQPQPLNSTVAIDPNCPEIPATTFAAVGMDAKAGALQFGKFVTVGELALKASPQLLSRISQSVRDDQITDALICAARNRGELKTQEQIAHAWTVARFYRTNSTPDLAIQFHKENPFPTTLRTQESAPTTPSRKAETDRRRNLLQTLSREYILSHDGISPGLMAGTEWPPLDWMNRRLKELGESWSVLPGKNSMEVRFSDR